MRLKRLKGFVILFMTASLLPIFWERSTSYSMDDLIEPCKSKGYLTIDSLFDSCNVPGRCGRKYECEGKIAFVKGLIDHVNVFDKTHYPDLPYEKFLISNLERNKSLEVWVVSENSDLIFKKIFKQKTLHPDGAVFIRGVLVGFDMPIMGACHRGLKIKITDENALNFDGNSLESGNSGKPQ